MLLEAGSSWHARDGTIQGELKPQRRCQTHCWGRRGQIPWLLPSTFYPPPVYSMAQDELSHMTVSKRTENVAPHDKAQSKGRTGNGSESTLAKDQHTKWQTLSNTPSSAQTYICKMGVVLLRCDVFHIKPWTGTWYIIFIITLIFFIISLWYGNKCSSFLSLLSPTFCWYVDS